MPTKTEPKRISDFLVWEVNPNYCRKLRTFRHTTGVVTSYEPGLVTEVITAKENPLATAGNAAGILLQPIYNLATATDLTNVLFLKKGPALVVAEQLNFNGQVAATALVPLLALQIDVYNVPAQSTTMPA